MWYFQDNDSSIKSPAVLRCPTRSRSSRKFKLLFPLGVSEFCPPHVTCYPPIRKRIWVGRYNNTFWPLWWRASLSIGVQTTVIHIQFVNSTMSTSNKMFFFRAWAEKGIDMRSVMWTLIENRKLANQGPVVENRDLTNLQLSLFVD